MSDHRYEAWRNLLLILAGILVADAAGRTREVQGAIASLGEFDRTFAHLEQLADIAAFLVVVFVFKSAHGVLVTLFREDYLSAVCRSRSATIISCALSTGIIMSLSMVLKLDGHIWAQDRLVSRSTWLMVLTLLPAIMFLVFDGFYLVLFARAEEATMRQVFAGLAREFASQIGRSPFRRSTMQEHRAIWLGIDVASLSLIGPWLLVVTMGGSRRAIILATLLTLIAQLLLHSAVDYVLNFTYFFFWKAGHNGAHEGARLVSLHPPPRPLPDKETRGGGDKETGEGEGLR